ncbi:MAG: hypothetical protein U0289_14810 [Cyclobacteriaceae bacterium]|jgi:hypothetical protein|nr:hypothetical protein [Cytophagales bacterium]HNP75718.1 hypothetical protein [Cyclobacteriaceae bacterium]HQQ82483.1 hypothetical protein [Cyclobacteriaceae bacterium]
MKWIVVITLMLASVVSRGQTIIGTWQLTSEASCLQTDSPLSDTEKELLPMMGGASQSNVARIIRFDAKGRGEESIFIAGRKKGADRMPFRYRVDNTQLQLLDTKSGMMTRGLVIDSLTQSVLIFHPSQRECEKKTFSRIR